MSHSLAPASPTVRAFDATVTAIEGREVFLEETYFYPEGGGQPTDRGVLNGIRIEHIRSVDRGVVHVLATEPDFSVGDEVTGVIDDDFRTYCMRAHTASHALYGAARHIFDDLGYGGFDISDEKVRVDFETSTTVDDDALAELGRLVNRVVWDSRDVSWEEISVSEARERDEVAFNVKTEEGVFADEDEVRIVTIEGWDWAACGGTHVSNTIEMGPIEIYGRSNPGEGLTRVEFGVGPAAIDHRATVEAQARMAATSLDSNLESLGEAANESRSARTDLEAELSSLKSEVLETRLAAFETVERDGVSWKIGSLDGFEANEVGEAAKVARDVDVLVAVGESNAPFLVVTSGGDVSAGDIVSDVTDEFGGGGGGGPAFAQGGGLGADAADVLAYLRS